MSSPPIRFLSNFLPKSPQGLSPLATSPSNQRSGSSSSFLQSPITTFTTANNSSALTTTTQQQQLLLSSSTPVYTLNDVPDDVYFLIASFLIPRVPQLCDANVRLYISLMINLSSISMRWREWAETITVQQNFWRDFLFQEMIRRNIRLSLVHASTFFHRDSSSSSSSFGSSSSSSSNNNNSRMNGGGGNLTIITKKNSVLEDVVRREKELRLDYMMNGGAVHDDNDHEEDEEEDDYFADDVGGVVGGFNDMNSLLRRGDYLSYTSGGPATTQRILLKIAMYPEQIKHMLFNISTYFHHEIHVNAKKGSYGKLENDSRRSNDMFLL
ncbi:hypothetical protein FDP41_001342 [Naegleria fowleri]|uniref:Uncharacterized protein n=1 Tax=Naegleria fowleri TaxID=5763 RepID=A0A6A5BZ96_NAEFO|nr:uncharacterized protein FDP41_001342 [Naegleria fowleri]KAF0979674.1 hypothetical protein FDP41_001342 [Naegleria fowleri]CAG4718975.1 unnamed protein product [Naegleria fowleri]